MSEEPVLVVVVVLVCGAAGASLRWALTRWWGPHGLLAANVLACLVAGAAMAAVTPPQPLWDIHSMHAPRVPLAALVAFPLGLGTFSTLAVESLQAAEHGGPGPALRMWLRHLSWGALAAGAGLLAVRLLLHG
ncbi:CrcB family protein [Micrococcus sp.]|uniref:CrcB family protein n=1 Tax=Micrococcus sp. TaxID=1271 RepID=UPI002A9119C1|nr:CrcB family protein [Micrococcus sp.]MDY6055077.1 CrcB family protein [Micrococcus sp.]